MTVAAPLLAFRRVACVRGGRLLFEGLDLELAPGEAAVVTGPNGAGKSSLLRLAAGLLGAGAGEVVRSVRAGFADEKPALDPKLTLGRALAFWARIDGVSPSPGMQAMGIAHLADVPVRILSTGQRKRAALARLVSGEAPLWLLDEPANGLDAEGLDRLTAAMAAHRGGGGAILAASHQPLGLDGAKAVAL
ncbi:MAG TPA: heme ABC exporter ATP-binding protein CcmA [Allosphingosinicella sp.]